MKDRKTGEMSINIPYHMTFIYFPKNFTSDLTNYFDDPEYYESQSYIFVSKESKYNIDFEYYGYY